MNAGDAEDDATTMAKIAALNSRQFRTMLKFMAGGLHIDQACALIAARAGTGLELLADDVNTCVAAVVAAAGRLPATLLAQGRPVGSPVLMLVPPCFQSSPARSVLSRCVFITEQEAVPVVLSQLRKANRLVGRPVDAVVADATALLEAQDTGPVVGLARERLKRSPEMHDPDFRARLAAAASAPAAGAAGGGAVAGVKRPRP